MTLIKTPISLLLALACLASSAQAQSPYNADGTMAGSSPGVAPGVIRPRVTSVDPSTNPISLYPQTATGGTPAYNPSAPYGYSATGAPLQAPITRVLPALPQAPMPALVTQPVTNAAAQSGAANTAASAGTAEFCAGNPSALYCGPSGVPTSPAVPVVKPAARPVPLALPGSGGGLDTTGRLYGPGVIRPAGALDLSNRFSVRTLPLSRIALAQMAGETQGGVRVSIGTNSASQASVICRGVGSSHEVRIPSTPSGSWMIPDSDRWTTGVYKCQVSVFDFTGAMVHKEILLTIR